MSPLERHSQLLLRVYPAAYREVRGEEILGTLLEATPPERSWPRPRDIRGLIFGGLRARAAFNRQLTTAANLRVAVLVGVAAYLAYSAVEYVSLDVTAVTSYGPIQPLPYGWPSLLASALTLVAAGLAVLTRKRTVLLAAALPAAAAVGYAVWGDGTGASAVRLALLAALVALVGGSKRPSPRWLALIGLLGVLPLVPAIGPPLPPATFGVLILAVGAVSIMWAVIDARPAIAVIVFFLALYLPLAAEELALGAVPVFALPYLAVLAVIGVAAIWLLRRQSARPGRPTRA